MHGENLPMQGGQEAVRCPHFAVAGRDGFDVVAFGGEVAAGIADGSSVIRKPVGKRGVVAYEGTVDEEEGVILAKRIVHGSLPRHRGSRCRAVLITISQSSKGTKCSLAFDPTVTKF